MKIQTHFNHRCAKCGRIRKAGSVMNMNTIVKNGMMYHEYSCTSCQHREMRKDLTLQSWRGVDFYR